MVTWGQNLVGATDTLTGIISPQMMEEDQSIVTLSREGPAIPVAESAMGRHPYLYRSDFLKK